MINTVEYDNKSYINKYNSVTDDMLYNIILNLRNNNLSFEDLADSMGLTVEELLSYMTSKNKDFFVCLEGISYFENRGIYKDYSKLIDEEFNKKVKL